MLSSTLHAEPIPALPLPPLEGITHFGCNSFLLANGFARSVAWADYDDEHLEAVRQHHLSLEAEKDFPHRGWVHLISVREGKNAKKNLKQGALDCVDWNTSVVDALKAVLKQKESQ